MAGHAGMTSVVVLCCGQLEYTRLCVPSVIRHTKTPYELIAVDAGSLDGTAEFWDGVQAAAPVRVEMVRCPADAALPDTLMDGVARASGEFVVLLNNDTIVPDGWLAQMIALISSNPMLGMVAPMSTFGPGPQVVWPVPYRVGTQAASALDVGEQVEAVNRFAADWRERHRGQWSEEERLGGACVLLRQSALQAVGPVKGMPLQFFDAELLSRRVRESGFLLACCRDLFVHSFGSRGFVQASATTAAT